MATTYKVLGQSNPSATTPRRFIPALPQHKRLSQQSLFVTKRVLQVHIESQFVQTERQSLPNTMLYTTQQSKPIPQRLTH
jgi:hypothetical protein